MQILLIVLLILAVIIITRIRIVQQAKGTGSGLPAPACYHKR